MIVAYSMSGHDNGSYYFEGLPKSFCCPDCGSIITKGYIPKRLNGVDTTKLGGLSYTFDGQPIVTERFKVMCETIDSSGLKFTKVESDSILYLMDVKQELAFDYERRRTKFEDYCDICKQYTQISGATPGFLKDIKNPIQSGFFCSDIEFGSYIEKNRLIIIGTETMAKLSKENFSFLEFQPVYGANEKVLINGIEF